MRSFGLNKFQLYIPFFIVSIFVGLMILFLNRELIPVSQVEFRNSVRSMESSQFLADIKEGRFFTSIPNVTIFSEKVGEEGKKLDKIFIHIDTPKEDKEQIIFSKKGNMLKKRDFATSSESLRLILENGNISNTLGEAEKLEKIIFDKYDFPITEGSFKPRFKTKPSMMNSSKLWQLMSMGEKEAKEAGYDKKYISKVSFEYWNRWNTPLLCIVFTFLGISIGVQDNRGKRKNVGSMSLVFLIAYYSAFFGLVTLSRKTAFPTSLAVFLPTIGTFLYGYKHFRKLNWIGS